MTMRSQILVLGCFLLTSAPAAAQSDAPPGRVGRLSYLSGRVSLQISGDSSWSDATINYPLATGDRLYVEQGGRAEVEFGGITLRLSDATDVTVTEVSDYLLQIGISSGSARLTVEALDADDSLELDTPDGPLVVTAPGVYRLSISPVRGTVVAVDRGAVTVGGAEGATSVQSGQAVALTADDTLRVTDIDVPDESDFDKWGGDRDRGLAASTSAQYVDPTTPGYADLDDAGVWETDAGYGPVWYPTVVVGWAPYRYGRWVWIEPWGWTWVESEPWGYAPFHYGRWVYVHRRWGWVPGPRVRRPCYAPALVVFVGVNRVGVQAWFPLGPREVYHPWYHASDRYRRRLNGDLDITTVDVTRTRYVNRDRGFTAVSSETFRGGIPVARRTVTVSPAQVTSARVIPHPAVMPTVVAMRGRPVPRPPVITNRVTTVVRPVPVRRQPITERPVTPPPPVQPRPEQPVRPTRTPPQVRPTLLRAQRPAPPPTPPVTARRQAIEQHPGRPLEPQQMQNLQRGEPAGPMKDKETPRDVRPQARPAPRAQPAPAPAKPEPKRQPKKPNG